MNHTVVWAFLIVTVLGFGVVALALALRFMVPQARRLLAALVVFEAALAVLHVVFTPASNTFAGWLFDLNLELTAGAVFSAAQYTVIALIALVNALRTPQIRAGQRLFWAVLIVLFVWLCADEFLGLHESVDSWRSFYALTGIGLVAFSAVMYRFFFRDDLSLFVPFLAGLMIMGGAGVVLDVLTNDHDLVVAGVEMRWLNVVSCDAAWNPVECGDVNTYGFVEEFLEMGGASLVFASVTSYFLRKQPPEKYQLLRRLALVAGAAWVLVWASNFWLLPSVVTAVEAETVQAEYLGGRLSLVGYDVSKSVLLPGDTVTVDLYFRANTPLEHDYRLATKLTTRYDDDPIAEADAQLGEWKYPTSAWIPGVTVRHSARLHIPEHVTTPRSYWLTVRVWHEEEEVEVVSESLQESGTGTVVLHGIPVLSEARPPEPPLGADYHFAAGPVLAGYDLPEQVTAGEPMAVRFWWRTDAAVPVELNQFVHVLVPGGEDVFVFDQAPFGGENFPSVYWPEGMDEMTQWDILLPPDLAPGLYGVYTGLYTLPDIIREPVTNGSGKPVLNNAIYLGDIVVEAP